MTEEHGEDTGESVVPGETAGEVIIGDAVDEISDIGWESGKDLPGLCNMDLILFLLIFLTVHFYSFSAETMLK